MPRPVVALRRCPWLLATAMLCWLLASAAPVRADAPPPVLLYSFEVLSAPTLAVDSAAASYAQREAVTVQVRDDLLPQVLSALEGVAEIAPYAARSQTTPGGYLLETNPSLLLQMPVPDGTADLIAASLGYAFRQSAVLVSDFGVAEGGTGYVVVSFPEDSLTASVTQAFFEHAATVEDGLGGGYTAIGDDMLFLNLRGGDGRPYSGLADTAFAEALDQAAGSFAARPARMLAAGEAEAWLIGNDWEAAPDGAGYRAVMAEALDDPAAATRLLRALDRLQAEHAALLLRAADLYGWPVRELPEADPIAPLPEAPSEAPPEASVEAGVDAAADEGAVDEGIADEGTGGDADETVDETGDDSAEERLEETAAE